MIISESSLGNFAYSLEGRMTVNGEAVIAYLAVIRIEDEKTDLSFYIADPGQEEPQGIRQCLEEFVRTFRVIDRGLFG